VSEPANPPPEDVPAGHAAETGTPRPALRPAPPALEVNTFALVALGEALWVVAFLVLLPFRDGRGLWLETCAAGFGLGLLGLFLSRHRRGR
jgi:Protein of unknown function (DUF2530)